MEDTIMGKEVLLQKKIQIIWNLNHLITLQEN